MTLNIATVKYAMCLYLKVFLKYSTLSCAIAGGLGGIWAIFEPMNRREEMAMYLFPKALEISGKYLNTRGIIKHAPYIEVTFSL